MQVFLPCEYFSFDKHLVGVGKEEMPKQASVSNAVCLLMSPGARFAKNDFVKRFAPQLRDCDARNRRKA